MKAVILAAGIASRLRPLTDNSPKCLLKVGSKNLLQRTIEALIGNEGNERNENNEGNERNEISEIVIVTGYRREMIEDFVSSNYPDLPVQFIYNERFETTNNIYSLWLVKEAVLNENILLLDSDILFDPKIITILLNATYPSCLALNKHELGEEEIKVIVDAENRIKEISKTCSVKDAIGESIGIEKMANDFVRMLFAELEIMIEEKGQDTVFYEVAFENIIRQGANIYAVDTTSCFSMELDTVADFETACSRIPANLC